MKVVIWCQNLPNFAMLNKAVQILNEKYGSLSVVAVIASSPNRGGVLERA